MTIFKISPLSFVIPVGMMIDILKTALIFILKRSNLVMKRYIYAFGAAFAARINRIAIYSADIIYYLKEAKKTNYGHYD